MQRHWQRFGYLAVLMAFSSSAHAGNSFSFTVGGHHIQIETSKNCDQPSCVSVSIPGIYQSGRRRVRDDDDDNRYVKQTLAAPVTAPASVPVAAPAPAAVCVPPPAASRPAETVASIPTPSAVAPVVAPAMVAPVAQQAPAVPPVQAPQPVAVTTSFPSVAATPVSPPPVPIARPAPEIAPKVSRVSQELEDEPTDSPLGDWQTEGNKGSVRIERCGEALCGYVLNLASNAKGETILIDMKPKATSKATSEATSEWSGNIYSRDSGNTYYATIAMKGSNSLQVKACALGHFFCSGNVWSRIDIKPMRTIATRPLLSKT